MDVVLPTLVLSAWGFLVMDIFRTPCGRSRGGGWQLEVNLLKRIIMLQGKINGNFMPVGKEGFQLMQRRSTSM